MAQMDRIPYEAPRLNAPAYNCPYCRAFAQQVWFADVGQQAGRPLLGVPEAFLSVCANCHGIAHWRHGIMIWPRQVAAELPHEDMPSDCVADFEEARNISIVSPRGAAALLRLVVQKLMPHLGEQGENLNDDISSLVSKGLPVPVQKALDACRVIGNNAVHPGEMALDDSPDIALELFRIVNFIVDDRIRRPKEIEALYDKLPPGARASIAKRDGNV